MGKTILITAAALTWGVHCYLLGSCALGVMQRHKIKQQKKVIKELSKTIDFLLEKKQNNN